MNVHISRSVLNTLPWAFAVCYLLPSTLMILPISETLTTDLKQIFIALWQPFPAYISILLTVINAVLSPFNSAHKTGRKDLRALRFVYAFAFANTAITHLVTWTISLTTVLAPAILDERFRRELHPSIVFGIPTPWTSPVVQVQSVADGVHAFLRWDYLIGSMAVVLWAGTLNAAAQRVVYGAVGWLRLVVQVVLLAVVAGPVGAAVELVWERDELVMTGMGRVTKTSEKPK